jgi:hypothetical protein
LTNFSHNNCKISTNFSIFVLNYKSKHKKLLTSLSQLVLNNTHSQWVFPLPTSQQPSGNLQARKHTSFHNHSQCVFFHKNPIRPIPPIDKNTYLRLALLRLCSFPILSIGASNLSRRRVTNYQKKTILNSHLCLKQSERVSALPQCCIFASQFTLTVLLSIGNNRSG